MKPKLSLIAVLALGLLIGGSLATSAFAASAGSAQYAPEEEERFCTEEEGGSGSGSGGSESGCEHEEEEVCEESGSGSGSGSEESGSGSGENCAPPPQPPSNLPYTGFPVVPALLVGLGLLGTGVAMRRRLGSGGGFA